MLAFVCNFSVIYKSIPASVWDYVTDCGNLQSMVSVCIIWSSPRILFLIRILVKTMSRKFDKLAKDRCFSRFHCGSRSIFVNTGEENWCSYFSNSLVKTCLSGLKISRDIETKYFFHFNPFSTGKIEKVNFWDFNYSTNVIHQ